MKNGLFLLVITVLLFPMNATGETKDFIVPVMPSEQRQKLSGMGVAIDGDTFVLTQPNGADVHIRLLGVDAPELKTGAPGATASAVLDDLLTDSTVECIATGKSYNRIVAHCKTHDGDIGAELIRQGVAKPARQYLTGSDLLPVYRAAEKRARDDGLGLWKEISTPLYENGWVKWAVSALVPFLTIGLATFLAYWNAMRLYNHTVKERNNATLIAIVRELLINDFALQIQSKGLADLCIEIKVTQEARNPTQFRFSIEKTVFKANATDIGRISMTASGGILAYYQNAQKFHDVIRENQLNDKQARAVSVENAAWITDFIAKHCHIQIVMLKHLKHELDAIPNQIEVTAILRRQINRYESTISNLIKCYGPEIKTRLDKLDTTATDEDIS